jgi:hypothetical protein
MEFVGEVDVIQVVDVEVLCCIVYPVAPCTAAQPRVTPVCEIPELVN